MKLSIEKWEHIDPDPNELSHKIENKQLHQNFLRFTKLNQHKENPLIQISNVPSLIGNSRNSAQQSHRSKLIKSNISDIQQTLITTNQNIENLSHRKINSVPSLRYCPKPTFTNIALVDLLKQKRRLSAMLTINFQFNRGRKFSENRSKKVSQNASRSDLIKICNLNAQSQNLVKMKHQKFQDFIKNMNEIKKEFQQMIQTKVKFQRTLKEANLKNSPHNVQKKFFTIF